LIAIRFDIDTHFGLVNRTPAVLNLVEAYGIRCTFFCVMGPEANILDILFLRFLKRGVQKGTIQTKQKGGFVYLLRTALFPRGVGCGNADVLRSIVSRGHEVQPHGWKHIQWQRNLENIDVREHLEKVVATYESIFSYPPTGFASPGRACNREVLRALDELGIQYAGDMDGDVPFRPEGFRHLQIPVTHFKTIAEMRAEGMDSEDIVDFYLSEIASRPEFCCFYEHPDNLFESDFAILRKVYQHIREMGLETLTHAEVLERFGASA